MKFRCLFGGLFMVMCSHATAQSGDALLKDSGWSFHFQFTGIVQYHPGFSSPYQGNNSFTPDAAHAYSVTTTAYIGRKLWKGASIYFNPEMSGGEGLSTTLGIAGFPNGETFRIGDAKPVVYTARIFLRQHFNLDKDHFVDLSDDINQVHERVSTSRITISLGKFGMADFFDQNRISHDPRNDFMNWALMNNGAYDYPANTRGYTDGLVVEYFRPGWVFRAATALVPEYANGPDLDAHYFKANGETGEVQKDYLIHRHPGSVRFLVYFNTSKAPAYRQVINDYLDGTDERLDVIYGKEYGGKKWGFGLNTDQEISERLKAFFRAGWNDGKTATWAFAEIDNTLSAGLRYYGIGRNRLADNIGLALLTNGISKDHRDFLNVGGYGFMIGDGKLPNYSRENIAEVFYEVKLFQSLYATADYQLVVNPAYNRDRGPIHLLAARVHVLF
ncbi:MAG TPA: carbohydrate porin [Puia sp.]|nr:carbohydrate porin [Puia sp.]